MLTYQDFLAVGENQNDIMAFVRSAISQYQASEEYKIAQIADLYDRKRNPDIADFTKTIFTVTGREIIDTYSSNYKIGRAFFPMFITQEVQYLLSNGITWQNEDTPELLGTKKYEFDTQLQDAAHKALVCAVSYGFWNLNHVDVFSMLEFCPLYDEENGALMAGIRWWQIDVGKPLRATLYEVNGYTDFIWNKRSDGVTEDKGGVLHEKRPYVIKITGTDIDEEKIYTGENYPTFPIVPLWGNKNHQSEIIGLREQIAAYDMIKSGFCDSVEEASYVYWAISNAPGMDERSLAEFLARVKRVHAAVTEDNGSVATPHQIEAPTQSRSELLDKLENDILRDAMAFDPSHVASGSATATEIQANYNLLNMKTNDFEYNVTQFVNGILELAGVDDVPTYTRDMNVNVTEMITAIMQASVSLSEDYVTKKIMTLLGDGDQADEVIEQMTADELSDIEDQEYMDEDMEDEDFEEDEELPEDEELEPFEDDEDDELDRMLDELLKELGD